MRWHLLLSVVLFFSAVTARAADFDKYLPDDTDGVLTFNVKQAVASPLYAKHVQKPLEKLIRTEKVKDLIKDTGFDPLKDLERVTLASSKSCWPAEGSLRDKVGDGGPFVIVQGNIDGARLKTLIEWVAKKEVKTKVMEHKVGQTSFWEVKYEGPNSLFLALPEKNVLVFCDSRATVLDVLEKGSGKKKTMLQNKAFQGLLSRLDSEQTITWAALGDTILNTRREVQMPNGQAVTVVKHQTLGESGIATILGTVTVTDEIKAQTTLMFENADKAKEITNLLRTGVEFGTQQLEALSKEMKELAPMIDMVKSITIRDQDKSVTVQGQAGADAIKAFLDFQAKQNGR